MRICHITSVHDLRFDARIVPKMAVSAAEAGHEVIVVAADREGLSKLEWNNVRVEKISLPRSRFQRWRNLGQVLSLAARQSADIYHLHDPELLPYAARLHRLVPGCRVVMDFHELLWADFLDKDYLPAVTRHALSWLWPKLESRWLKAVDGVVLAADSLEFFYRRYEIPRVTVRNYPLIPSSLPQPPDPPTEGSPLEMVYIGAIMPTRAVLEFVRADKILSRRRQGGARLHIYGPLDDPAYVRQIEKEFDGSGVTLHGILPHARLFDTLSHMHISFALFYDRPASYESLPTKLLESMVAGVPVVASDRPVIRKYLSPPEGGLVVNSLDPKEIAEAVLKIAGDPAFYGSRSRAAQKRVADLYSWGGEAKKLMQFYERMVTRGVCTVRGSS